MREHRCPIDGGRVQVPEIRLMCGRHWWMVPEGIRREIWRQYRRYPTGPAHRRACAEGIAAVNRQLATREAQRAQPELAL
jgi:hypothetical protein